MVVRPRLAGSEPRLPKEVLPPSPPPLPGLSGRFRCGVSVIANLPFEQVGLLLPTVSALARSRAVDTAGWGDDNG
ncbi:hypothetical protein GCM10010327_21230 [Streptomyces nitrosporeus]|nr:hypothetical protein GCM10010327_21230 [Streptomyces nitrosporeus]